MHRGFSGIFANFGRLHCQTEAEVMRFKFITILFFVLCLPAWESLVTARQKPQATEATVYRLIYDHREGDPGGLITLGEAFVEHYPNSVYAGSVYGMLAVAYCDTNQADRAIGAATKALRFDPDDAELLAMIAVAVSRTANEQSSEGLQELQSATAFAKHGIDVLVSMAKPPAIDEATFAASRNEDLASCHSALGTVAVKLGHYPEAVAELSESIRLSSVADPVDYYLLGISDSMTRQFTAATETFRKCASAGPVQNLCQSELQKMPSSASLDDPIPAVLQAYSGTRIALP